MRTPSGHKVYAIGAEYSSASALYEAAKRVRDAGFKRWDVFSPFPIHGMDEAMGLGKSWLSAVVLVGGITGLLTAVILEFGPSWFLYPVIVHGKPFNWATVPAFFPIMFELTVLFSAFSAFFADGRCPRVRIASPVPIGYESPWTRMKAPPEITPSGAPAGEEFSHTPIGFSVGTDYYNTGKMAMDWGTGIRVPVNAELMQRGQQRFNITCSVCHGLTAAGNGIAKQYGLNTVATLQDERIRKMADGEIFNTVTNGKNTMMSYGGNVPVADRWAIIAYVRALQRSQNAAASDYPPV